MVESNAVTTITRPRRRCCTTRERVVVKLLSKHWFWASSFARLCAVNCPDGTASPDCHFALHGPGVVCHSYLQKSTSANPFALRIQAPVLAVARKDGEMGLASSEPH
mgnify:CR=1 FL=1